MRKLIILLMLLGASAIADEQQYRVTITITKDCTLKDALQLAEKYGKDGVISITPIQAQQDSGFFFYPRRQWFFTPDTIIFNPCGSKKEAGNE